MGELTRIDAPAVEDARSRADTISGAWALWQLRGEQRVSSATRTNYRSCWRHVQRLPERPAEHEIRAWLDELVYTHGLRPTSANAVLAAFKAIVQWAAHRSGLYGLNREAIDVAPLPLDEVERDPPPADLLLVSLGACLHMGEAAFLLTLGTFGLRPGELLAVKRHELDLSRGVLHVRRTVGGAGRKNRRGFKGLTCSLAGHDEVRRALRWCLEHPAEMCARSGGPAVRDRDRVFPWNQKSYFYGRSMKRPGFVGRMRAAVAAEHGLEAVERYFPEGDVFRQFRRLVAQRTGEQTRSILALMEALGDASPSRALGYYARPPAPGIEGADEAVRTLRARQARLPGLERLPVGPRLRDRVSDVGDAFLVTDARGERVSEVAKMREGVERAAPPPGPVGRPRRPYTLRKG